MPAELLNTEDYVLPEATYSIVAHKVSRSFRGEWTCPACGAKDSYALLCPTIEDAITYAKLDLAIRHHARHRQGDDRSNRV